MKKFLVLSKLHIKRAKEAYSDWKNDKGWKNFDVVTMECFQAVNYIISYIEKMIKERDLGYPLSYGELADILLEHNIITKSMHKTLIGAISIRNKIAHAYYKISEEQLEELYTYVLKLESMLSKLEAA